MNDFQQRMDALYDIVTKAWEDPDAQRMIIRQARGILTHLGASEYEARQAFLEITAHPGLRENFADSEQIFREKISAICRADTLPLAMGLRADLWFDVLQPHLDLGSSDATLDLGGGSGEVARRIAGFGECPVTVADVLDWRKEDVPFLPVIGNHVDARDGGFEQVVVVTAFHHSDDPPALVAEAFRLARHRIVFIESVVEDRMMYLYAAWIDWFYNHIIHFSPSIEHKINVPCNFLPAVGWEQLVAKLTGLQPKVSQNLGIFQFLNPEQHHLFVYEKF